MINKGQAILRNNLHKVSALSTQISPFGVSLLSSCLPAFMDSTRPSLNITLTFITKSYSFVHSPDQLRESISVSFAVDASAQTNMVSVTKGQDEV